MESRASSTVSEGQQGGGGRVACVAIVGANVSLARTTAYTAAHAPAQQRKRQALTARQNAPLYLRMFEQEGVELNRKQLHEVIYNSLDVIEERLSPSSVKARNGDLGGFVGCLAVVGALSIFGSVGSTHRKTLVAVAEGASDVRDARIRGLFDRLAAATADCMANPFASVDGPLAGDRFDAAVAEAVARFA